MARALINFTGKALSNQYAVAAPCLSVSSKRNCEYFVLLPFFFCCVLIVQMWWLYNKGLSFYCSLLHIQFLICRTHSIIVCNFMCVFVGYKSTFWRIFKTKMHTSVSRLFDTSICTLQGLLLYLTCACTKLAHAPNFFFL